LVDIEADTMLVTFRVSNARPAQARQLFALVDVEVLIGGVTFDIIGIQARREPGDRTSVRLPTFKDADGIWRPAIRLPDEVRGPLADAVLAFLMEEGLAKRRFEGGQCNAVDVQHQPSPWHLYERAAQPVFGASVAMGWCPAVGENLDPASVNSLNISNRDGANCSQTASVYKQEIERSH
jgi:stage V sporulation protein G